MHIKLLSETGRLRVGEGQRFGGLRQWAHAWAPSQVHWAATHLAKALRQIEDTT